MIKRNSIITILIFFLYFCTPISLYSNLQQKTLKTYTGIAPINYLVKRVGGKLITTYFLLAENSNPETYSPSIRQVDKLMHVDAYFELQLPFEKIILKKIYEQLQFLKNINLNQGLQLRKFTEHNYHHQCKNKILFDKNKEKHQFNNDPHTWMSSKNTQAMTTLILEFLLKKNPCNNVFYKRSYLHLIKELRDLDKYFKKLFYLFRGDILLIYHPSFGYFTDQYKLRQRAIENEGKDPTLRQLKNIIKFAKEKKITTLFIQTQFYKHSSEVIAKAINAKIVELNPLDQDYINNLRIIGIKIISNFT